MGMRVDGSEFRAGRIFLLMVHLEAATNELQIIPLQVNSSPSLRTVGP